jgi:hypothetical protein
VKPFLEWLKKEVLKVLKGMQVDKKEYEAMNVEVEIHTRTLYEEVCKIVIEVEVTGSYGLKQEAMMNTKYKTVAKKVKSVATQLPFGTN